VEQAEIEKLIGELEIGLDRLRSLYEQYFMGLERIEPAVVRKDVDRRVYVLRREQIRNTGLRFRFQMLLQRYNTFQAHWQRICREIENGTYKRHMARARQRFGDEASVRREADRAARASLVPEPGAPVALDFAAELAELDKDFAPAAELDDLDVVLDEETRPLPLRKPGLPPPRPQGPSQPSVPPPARPGNQPGLVRKPDVLPAPTRKPGVPSMPPPLPNVKPAGAPVPAPSPARTEAKPAAAAAWRPAAPKAPTELPEERVRQIYAQYVDTKRRQNESTAAITYEAVAKSLRDSSAKLREKHGKTVDFEVRVKDGRTILKPVVK
jgi:hypothetical protein